MVEVPDLPPAVKAEPEQVRVRSLALTTRWADSTLPVDRSMTPGAYKYMPTNAPATTKALRIRIIITRSPLC